MTNKYGLTKARHWLRVIGQEVNFAAWFMLHAIARCILVTIIIIALGLALGLPLRSVRADGTQTLGDAVRYYVPDNAWVLSTWRYSAYGQPWGAWINNACAYAGACGADAQAPTILRTSQWGIAWWQRAQYQVQQVPIAIQTQIPNAPPAQDFVPGWRAYAGAAWEVAKSAPPGGSLFALINSMNAYNQSVGGMLGTRGAVGN